MKAIVSPDRIFEACARALYAVARSWAHLVVIIIIAALGATCCALTAHALDQTLKEKTHNLCHSLIGLTEEYFEMGEWRHVQKIIQGAAKADSDVRYIVFLHAADGQILASTDPKLVPLTYVSKSQLASYSVSTYTLRKDAGRELLQAVCPVPNDTQPAILIVGISQERVAVLMRNITLRVAVAIMLAGLICWLLVLNLTNARTQLQNEVKHRAEAEVALSQRAYELDKTNQRLIAVERQKDEFFATISHELRTPLALIVAPLESLIEDVQGKMPDSQQNMLKVMHNNVLRLLQLVSGLLDFSKLEAGKWQVQRRAVNVYDLTRSIVFDFLAASSRKKVALEFQQCNCEEAVVSIDSYLFERILFNLLSNALKFTSAGGRITVTLNIDQENLLLSVADTGIGISADNISNLFQKFRQIEGPSTRRFEGTGLGLAMVKEFAELLDGSVDVESQLGQGSKFTVKLKAPPCETAPAETHDSSVRSSRPPEIAVPSLTATGTTAQANRENKKNEPLPTVLIAEDNVELASYIQSLLAQYCDTRVTTDGEAALQLAGEWCPDLIITDVMMPKRDGLSLCRELKSQPATRCIPVVMLTAMTDRNAMLQGWQAGADEYLFKPFHPTELVTRVTTLLQNVGYRKHALAEISNLNATLEARVLDLASANRTLEQLTVDLEQARDHAVQASQYKSRFLANMSHEIRTPLNGVVGMCEILLGTQLNTDQKEIASILQRSSQVLLSVVNDILDFAKIEAGKVELQMGDFDVNKLVEGTADLVVNGARQKGLNFCCSVDPSLPAYLHGDAGHLRQILLNLLTNAIKFTEQGHVSLSATLVEKHAQACTVLFAVTDTGVGLSTASIQQLFRPFMQADSTISREYGGTGLGLSIAKHLVELMQGEIGVQSVEGKGCTFWFTVTLPAAHVTNNGRGTDSQVSNAPLSASCDPLTPQPALVQSEVGADEKLVLVAEDNPVNQRVAVMLLERLGMRAMVANNGRDALASYQPDKFSLILMDCQMPDMDGFEATREIRRLEAMNSSRVPIIAVTAQALEGDREKCIAGGMDDYMSKPVTTAKLKDVIRRWVIEQDPACDSAFPRSAAIEIQQPC